MTTTSQPAHIIVLNRFDNEFGEYTRYLSPAEGSLTYVTLERGLAVLDTASARRTEVVADLELETVRPVVRRLVDTLGQPAGIVGLSEWDLLTAAQLCAEFAVAGWPVDLVRRFRDKPTMKRHIHAAGLRAPRFVTLDAAHDVATATRSVIAALGLPVIVKPRAGVASAGVVRAQTTQQLSAALTGLDLAAYECEEVIDGDVLHVDGLRRHGRAYFVTASAYVNTCLDFANGRPLGSVLLDHGPRRERVVAFAERCLDALSLRDGPFHLELFHTPADELVFLEVGLRPGGGPLPTLHRELFGVDLVAEAFRATLALPPTPAPAGGFPRPPGGGWLIFPEPRPLPCRVVARTSLLGKVGGVYAEVIPDEGEIFDGTGGYLHVGGTFRLTGPDEAAVRADVHAAIDAYNLVCVPLDRADQ